MRLGQRLLVGALLVIGVFLLVVLALTERGLRARLIETTVERLSHEAALVGQQWTGERDDDSLANAAGAALGLRVTLIDATGRVLGDSEFDGVALAQLENHRGRPEVLLARQLGMGSDIRLSQSVGDEELYVARATSKGVARVALGTNHLGAIVSRARGAVLIAAAIATVLALALAALFSRAVSRPIVELRDVARDIADGNLARRPALSAPGEVGDLAAAVRRMGELLDTRLAAMEADEMLLVGVVEALNEGVLAIGVDRRVVRANAAARRLLGLRDEVPFPLDRLPRDRHLRQALDSALQGLPTDGVELTLEGRTMALTARPIARGGAVVALFDLTAMRRLETIRRDFVANVSHELRTPLTAVSGFAETLADENVDEDQRRRFANTIRVNAHRMQRIVDDLLDLSRIESGGWVPNPMPVDVEAIAAEAAAPCQRVASDKGVDIRVEIDARARSAIADPTALRQILANLVDNAVRYTNAGGSVTVFTEADSDGVWVGVRDTGSGISAEHLPRIFERFYRVDPGRSREAGGTGLGLSIVKHLAEAHGGRVHAESTPRRGTRVAAFFPDGAVTRP